MFLVFSLVFLFIFGLGNYYAYRRLFCQISFLLPYRKWVFLALCLLYLCEVAFFLFRADDYFRSDIYALLARSFGISYFFFFITLFADILRLGIYIWLKKSKQLPLDPKRRASLKLIFNLSLLVFAIGLVFRGWGNAVGTPKVKKLELSLKNLRQDFRLVMISDVHLGKNLHESFLSNIIERINDLNADIVVIVGDLVDTKPDELNSYIHKLDTIKSKYGVFYSLGNHEYYRGLAEVLALLKQTKLKILINDSVELDFVNIAGLADLAGLRFAQAQNGLGLSGLGLNGVLNFVPDIEQTTAKLNPNKPSILLSHQPKSVKLYDMSNFDLILSGHTHAGQVFPFGALVLAQQGFLHGLYGLSEKSKLYVSSGAGFWGPAIRFLAPSEIVCMDIKGE